MLQAYNDGYFSYPAPKPCDYQNYAQDPFSHPQNNQPRLLLARCPVHSWSPCPPWVTILTCDIRTMPLTDSPRSTRHDLLSSSSSSYAVSIIPAAGSLSAASRCFRAWHALQSSDLNIPVSHRTFFKELNPHNSVSTVRGSGPWPRRRRRLTPPPGFVRPFPGVFADSWLVLPTLPQNGRQPNDICYSRIPQRVRRRYKALKCIWCVYYSTCLPIRLADPFRSYTLVQTLPQQYCA